MKFFHTKIILHAKHILAIVFYFYRWVFFCKFYKIIHLDFNLLSYAKFNPIHIIS